MKILLTNDDGYESDGIKALAEALIDIADVVIAAPMYEKSGASSSISIHNPLRYKPIELSSGVKGFAIDGSPTDAVKLSLARFIDRSTVDLAISGINHGPNIATNVLYSGTVGGAVEAAIWGIPSIALSLAGFFHHNFESTKTFIKNYIKSGDYKKITAGAIFNINVPDLTDKSPLGVKYTTISKAAFLKNYAELMDPFADPYYWLSDFEKAPCPDKLSDVNALKDGYISISPMLIDMTDHKFLDELNGKKG